MSVKRRLVQAMLFPDSENDVVKGDCEELGNGKKKRGRPKSANSNPRASKKKVQTSAEGALDLKGDDAGSIDVTELGTSSKISEKRNQKRQCKEQACIIGEDDSCASPSTPAADLKASPKLKRRANSTPRKQQSNLTPKRKLVASATKRSCFGQTSPDFPNDESVMKPLPNLRLEAKFIAEENSRIYAGKQVHPFFMSRKVDKRTQDMVDEGIEQPSVEKDGKETGIYPVHIYEKLEDIAATLDWKQWTFSDINVANSSCTPYIEQSPIFRGQAKPLQFDNYLGVPLSNSKSLCQNPISQNPSVSLDQEVRGTNTTNCLVYNSNNMIHDTEQQITFHQDSGLHHPENCLWTDKHMPENPLKVCGNDEAVKHLSEWLHLWHTSSSRASKVDEQNGNSISYQTDRDSEDMNEEPSLENVLLITGPVGSGKSAAIYACAKEQGFQVIEVSASDWRSGSLVKQRFGEAVESHWVRGADMPSSEVKSQTRSFPSVTLKEPESDVVGLLTLSDTEDVEHAPEGVTGPSWDDEIITSNSQKELKTLILFEDVDATLCDDYGFISAIHLLSKTAKRPMILTSNSDNPLLPSNLDRLHVRFTMPSMEELTGLASMVCAAEEASIHPCLVEHFSFLFKRDIRKTILNLQFWFQGQDYRKGNGLQSIKNLHLLDLDASHWVLPKLIPWSCPSRLSKFVDEEITKSLMIMSESANLRETVDGLNQKEYQLNDTPITDGGHEYSNSKKEEMLGLHWSLEDDIELAAPSDAICDLNGFPHSPATDTQTLGRRNFNSVIFSDNEDEYLTERKPAAFRRMLENSHDEGIEVHSTAPSTSLLGERCKSWSSKSFNPSKGEKVEEECTCQCAGMVDCSHMNGVSQPVDLSYSHIDATSKSFDVSYVPESLIIPETPFDYDNPTELSSKIVISDHNLCEVPIDFQGIEIFNSLVSVLGEECIDCSHINGTSQPVELSYSHIEACNSFDVSCVPESLIVPETLLDHDNQTKFSSKTVNTDHNLCKVPIDLQRTEIFNSFVSVEGEECLKCSPVPYENQDACASSCHISLRSVNTDVVGDSQFNQEDYIPKGYQIIDECSRLDFIRRCESFQMISSTPHDQIDFVQKTWRKLLNSKVEVRQLITTQERDVVQALEITSGLSNVISDADLLLKDCQPYLHDSVDPLMTPREGLQSYNWHDHQLEMASSFAEHGICLFAKESALIGPKMGSVHGVDLSWEMLALSENTMALGNLISRQSTMADNTKINLPGSCFQSKSETKSRLSTVLQCVVPTRSYLSLQGDACHEYLSSLSQISRVEANNLSEHVNKGKQRRTRVPRHYLKGGSFTLTPDDISFLGQWNNYEQLSS